MRIKLVLSVYLMAIFFIAPVYSKDTNSRLANDNGVLTNKTSAVQETNKTADAEEQPEKAHKWKLFLLNPAGFVYNLANHSVYEIDMEWQFALFRFVSFYITPQVEFGTFSGYIPTDYEFYNYNISKSYYFIYSYYNNTPYAVFSGTMGLMIMPFGNYMNGLFIRAGLGGGMSTLWSMYHYYYLGIASVGYQFVFDFGLAVQFGITGGFVFFTGFHDMDANSTSWILNIELAKIGWAF